VTACVKDFGKHVKNFLPETRLNCPSGPHASGRFIETALKHGEGLMVILDNDSGEEQDSASILPAPNAGSASPRFTAQFLFQQPARRLPNAMGSAPSW